MFLTGGVLLFVVVVAVANLCLGYGTAVYCGRGPQRWAGIDALPPEPDLTESDSDEAQPPDQIDPAPDDQLTPEPEANAQPEPDVNAQPEPNANPESDPEHEQGPLEKSIRDIKKEVVRHRDELIQLDQRVRNCTEQPTTSELKRCADDLAGANRRYQEQQRGAIERLEQLHVASGEHSAFGRQVQRMAEAQIEQAQDTLDRLDHIELDDKHLQEYCKALLDETFKGAESCSEVRDSLDMALTGIVDGVQGEGEEEPLLDLPADERADTLLKASLASALKNWQDESSQKESLLSIGLVDADRCQEVNEKFGPLVGDKVIQAIAEIVRSAEIEGGELVESTGQQFVLSFYGIGPKDTTGIVERVRQTIEEIRFELTNEEMRATVSCAVVEAYLDDTPETLFERLVATLREAKRYGRNRTFLYEGEYPTPVVPPSLDIVEKTLPL